MAAIRYIGLIRPVQTYAHTYMHMYLQRAAMRSLPSFFKIAGKLRDLLVIDVHKKVYVQRLQLL